MQKIAGKPRKVVNLPNVFKKKEMKNRKENIREKESQKSTQRNFSNIVDVSLWIKKKCVPHMYAKVLLLM